MAETKRRKAPDKQRANDRRRQTENWEEMSDIEEHGRFLVYTGPIGGVKTIDEAREDRDRYLLGR